MLEALNRSAELGSLWACWTCFVLAARRGIHSRILWPGTLALAVSLTLQTSLVYGPLDRLLGGRNYTILAQQVMAVVAIALLARFIVISLRPSARIGRTLGIALAVSVVAQLVFFLSAGELLGSDRFLSGYLKSPPVALFLSVTWIAMLVIAATAAHVAFGESKASHTGWLKAALWTIGLGATMAGVTSGLFFARWALPQAGLESYFALTSSVSALLIGGGLALPLAVETINDVSVTSGVILVWRQTGAANGPRALRRPPLGIEVPVSFDQMRRVVYRRKIEIFDHLTAIERALSKDQESVMRRAQNWLSDRGAT